MKSNLLPALFATLILVGAEGEPEVTVDGLTDEQVRYAGKNSRYFSVDGVIKFFIIPVLDDPTSAAPVDLDETPPVQP